MPPKKSKPQQAASSSALPPAVKRSRALLRASLRGGGGGGAAAAAPGGALLRELPTSWTRLAPGAALAAVSGCDIFVRRGGAGGGGGGGGASAATRCLLSLPGRLAPLAGALAAGARLGELAGLDGPNPTLTLDWPVRAAAAARRRRRAPRAAPPLAHRRAASTARRAPCRPPLASCSTARWRRCARRGC